MEGGIENGGATKGESAEGAGKVCGSLLGGNVNNEEGGRDNRTVGEDMSTPSRSSVPSRVEAFEVPEFWSFGVLESKYATQGKERKRERACVSKDVLSLPTTRDT